MLALLVSVQALLIDVMEIDAAKYAAMSLEILEKGQWLEIIYKGEDHLDKPPLLFWLSAMSMWILGISTWAYKLPSLLIGICGLYATKKYADLYYPRPVGIIAAVLLGSCEGYLMLVNDVRTDTNLTGLVMLSIWQLASYYRGGKLINWLLGFVALAGAMLAKGPIGLMIPVLGFSAHFMLVKDYKQFYNWRWYSGIIVVILLLLPMLYGLYIQWGWKGIEFYFWTQSFGRITGASEWNNGTGYLYFVHTSLWAYLPWTLLLIFALYDTTKKYLLGHKPAEHISYWGFLLAFIALSFSHYKLPHYIFVVYPLCSILTANYIYNLYTHPNKIKHHLVRLQLLLMSLLLIIGPIMFQYVFPISPLVWIGYTLCLLLYLYVLKSNVAYKLIIASTVAIWSINYLLYFHFYPHLIPYQSSSLAGKYIADLGIDKNSIYSYETDNSAFDFYAEHVTAYFDISRFLQENARNKRMNTPGDTAYIFTNEGGYAKLRNYTKEIESQELKLDVAILAAYPHFPITKLNFTFLNPATRQSSTEKMYLIKAW